MFLFLKMILFFYVTNILILPFLPIVCFHISTDVLNEKHWNLKELIPFICVVFSNVVLSWKNASVLPVQSSGSKGVFCQVEVCEIHVTKNTHFLQLQDFSCFFSAFLRVVCVSQIKT